MKLDAATLYSGNDAVNGDQHVVDHGWGGAACAKKPVSRRRRVRPRRPRVSSGDDGAHTLCGPTFGWTTAEWIDWRDDSNTGEGFPARISEPGRRRCRRDTSSSQDICLRRSSAPTCKTEPQQAGPPRARHVRHPRHGLAPRRRGAGQAMGCYAFCRRGDDSAGAGAAPGSPPHSLSPSRGGGGSGSGGMQTYKSVSHFNLIHFSCHRDARRGSGTTQLSDDDLERVRRCARRPRLQQPAADPRAVGERGGLHGLRGAVVGAYVSPVRVDAPRRWSRTTSGCCCCALRSSAFSTYSKGGGRENPPGVPYLVPDGDCAPRRARRAQRRTSAAAPLAPSPPPADRVRRRVAPRRPQLRRVRARRVPQCQMTG